MPTDMSAYIRETQTCSVVSLLSEMTDDEKTFDEVFSAISVNVHFLKGTLGKGLSAIRRLCDIIQVSASLVILAFKSDEPDPLRLVNTLQRKPNHLDAIPRSVKSIEEKKLVIGNNTFAKSDLAYLDSISGRAARSDGAANSVLPCFVSLGWQRGQYHQILYPQVSENQKNCLLKKNGPK